MHCRKNVNDALSARSYQYTPPRPLEEIEADIKTIEQDILQMLREVAG